MYFRLGDVERLRDELWQPRPVAAEQQAIQALDLLAHAIKRLVDDNRQLRRRLGEVVED